MITARDLEGAWQTERYVVAGRSTSVDGVLILTAGRWAVLYFVPGPSGPWGSAEAGSYSMDKGRLTFRHRLMFQGGGGRPIEMNQNADRVEVCDITLEGPALTIRFPSGNDLHLQRMTP